MEHIGAAKGRPQRGGGRLRRPPPLCSMCYGFLWCRFGVLVGFFGLLVGFFPVLAGGPWQLRGGRELFFGYLREFRGVCPVVGSYFPRTHVALRASSGYRGGYRPGRPRAPRVSRPLSPRAGSGPLGISGGIFGVWGLGKPERARTRHLCYLWCISYFLWIFAAVVPWGHHKRWGSSG